MAEDGKIKIQHMSTPANNISLLLSEDTIKQARNSSHALATLIALQSFVASTAQTSDLYTPAYEAIKSIIERHTAELRTLTLLEQADSLGASLQRQDSASIARVHEDISRNGFCRAAQQAIGKLDSATLSAAKKWANHWCIDAKSRALAASGYPDALDFHKANISPQEYAAMTEISNYLNDQP